MELRNVMRSTHQRVVGNNSMFVRAFAGLIAILTLSIVLGCATRSTKTPTPAAPDASATKEAPKQQEADAFLACAKAALDGFRQIAPARDVRFEGKVSEANALCRGGQRALQFRGTPWVDWSNYWGTSDGSSIPKDFISSKLVAQRGVAGALLDLEYQRVELIKFNLFDNSGTYEQFISGRDGVAGQALKVWPAMRLKPAHPNYKDVGGDGQQICQGNFIRWRTVDGICNDVLNPAMGSSGQLFARNVEFETTFPESNQNQYTRNRHSDRLGLLQPDPQVISRRLFTRVQSNSLACHDGYGLPDYSKSANCDY